MATEANLDQEKDDNNQPVGTGGGSVASQSDTGGSVASPAAPMHNSTPSGTPNIQSYLRANQGAGQQLAQGIGNQFQKQTNQFGQQVQQAGNQAQSQANPLQQQLGSQAQNVITTSFKNPQDLLNQQDQLAQFQKLRDQGYQGDISNVQQNAQTAQQKLQSQLSGIQQQAQGAGTESGRFQLLRNTFGQPQYTQGQQKLDQLFLQAQPGAGQQLKSNLSGLTNQAGQQLTGTTAEVQAKLNALNNLSSQNATDIQNVLNTGNYNGQHLGTGLNDITTNVGNEYTQGLQNSTNANAGLQAAFAANQFTPQQLQQLGLTQGQQTWGVDLAKAGQYAANPLLAADQGGNAQVATPEEFARYNALNQLAGNKAPQNIFGTATTAGGYNPYNFDSTALNQAISDKKATVAKTDALNALSQVRRSNIAHGGNDDLINGMAAGIQNGTMTPDQAYQAYVNESTHLSNISLPNSSRALYNQLIPFLNYYNSEYVPAAAKQIGATSPEATPLPVAPGGTVNWGQIQAPTGAAGKGADTPLDPTKYLQGK